MLHNTMRRQPVLAVSILANIALLAAFLWWRPHHQPAPPPAAADSASSNSIHTHVVVRKQFFSWQELESSDYQQYIQNLRAIGCPEPTIRDIIIADVNQLYLNRFVNEVVDPNEEWWRSVPATNLISQSA